MTPIFKILTPRVLKNKHLHRKYQLQPAASGQVFDKFRRTLHAATGNRREIVSNKENFSLGRFHRQKLWKESSVMNGKIFLQKRLTSAGTELATETSNFSPGMPAD